MPSFDEARRPLQCVVAFSLAAPRVSISEQFGQRNGSRMVTDTEDGQQVNCYVTHISEFLNEHHGAATH
jgi:hypothetical protein